MAKGAVEDALANVLEQSTKIADMLTQLAVEHAPQAVDVILLAARVDAISAIAGHIIAVLMSSAVLITLMIKRKQLLNWLFTGGEGAIIGYVLLHLVPVVVFLINLGLSINVWAIMGIYDPRLWLAAKALQFV